MCNFMDNEQNVKWIFISASVWIYIFSDFKSSISAATANKMHQ